MALEELYCVFQIWRWSIICFACRRLGSGSGHLPIRGSQIVVGRIPAITHKQHWMTDACLYRRHLTVERWNIIRNPRGTCGNKEDEKPGNPDLRRENSAGEPKGRIYFLLLFIVQHVNQLDHIFVPQPPQELYFPGREGKKRKMYWRRDEPSGKNTVKFFSRNEIMLC